MRWARIVARQVAAGLILDDYVQCGRIGVRDLLEEDGVDVPVDGWGEEQLGAMRAVHFPTLHGGNSIGIW